MKVISSKPQEIIVSAVKKYLDFITPTYGPAGKKILIVQNEFTHEAVDDGKRSSQAFELEDELENAVILHIKETTQRGKDGTTTAGIIMANLVLEALKDLGNDFIDKDYYGITLQLKKGLAEALKEISPKKIKNKEELYAIAYNSYNDTKIAKLVADTVYEIGKDGVLSIEDSKTTDTSVEIVNGLEIQKGYYSPYFINQEDKVVFDNPVILTISKKLILFSDIAEILKEITQKGLKNVVIMADSFGDDVVNKCIAYKMMGAFQPLLIEVPGYGDKSDSLKDIASIVGSTVIDDKVIKLSEFKLDYLGSADLVKSTKDKTIFLGGAGKPKEYINLLKKQLEAETNEYTKQQLTNRIAALLGGVAVIKVGAYTENEQRSIKTKVENAINSTQIAFRSGVVEGAGKALADITTSSELLNKALKAPREQLEKNGANYLDKNTVDPAEVVTTALETAVSIASGLIMLGGIVAPKIEEKKDSKITY